jgi:hypothetical protein
MLKVAPVSTKYLSFVSSSVRKISPALVGKCIAVAVACAGLAAEAKMVWRQTSFPTKYRVEHTCEPCYKGYNLVGVTTVEESAMIGMTALVY